MVLAPRKTYRSGERISSGSHAASPTILFELAWPPHGAPIRRQRKGYSHWYEQTRSALEHVLSNPVPLSLIVEHDLQDPLIGTPGEEAHRMASPLPVSLARPARACAPDERHHAWIRYWY